MRRWTQVIISVLRDAAVFQWQSRGETSNWWLRVKPLIKCKHIFYYWFLKKKKVIKLFKYRRHSTLLHQKKKKCCISCFTYFIYLQHKYTQPLFAPHLYQQHLCFSTIEQSQRLEEHTWSESPTGTVKTSTGGFKRQIAFLSNTQIRLIMKTTPNYQKHRWNKSRKSAV